MRRISVVLILIQTMISSSIFGQLTSQEDKFWTWFKKNERRLYTQNKEQEKLFDEISAQLKKVNEGLVFEFSPIHEDGTREFTISADGIKDVFPSVIELVSKAPVINNWKINAFRQRVPGDDLSIKFSDGVKVGDEDIYFRHENENGKIGIELHIKNFTEDNAQLKNATFILLDALIGEYDMETIIRRAIGSDCPKFNKIIIHSAFLLS